MLSPRLTTMKSTTPTIPNPPRYKPPKDLKSPGNRIRLELYEMRKTQAELAAKQKLFQQKMAEERQIVESRAAKRTEKVELKLRQAEILLSEIKKPAKAQVSETTF